MEDQICNICLCDICPDIKDVIYEKGEIIGCPNFHDDYKEV